MATELDGKIALVTGASQGIGAAIASALARAGMQVWMVSRRVDVLQEAATAVGSSARPFSADLTDADARESLMRAVSADGGVLDVLVHSAGVQYLGRTDDASEEHFREQLDSNVLAPYALTRACLPLLRRQQGQIVFINSSAGKSADPGRGQYSASQHAVRAFADSLRAEINPDGIRVTVIHPGRTATPRQEQIHAIEDRQYRPERLLQPSDVAEVVVAALSIPRTAEVTQIDVRSMLKP